MVCLKIVLTGTPGAGKSVLAKKIAAELGCTVIDANALVKERKLYSRVESGSKVVKLNVLRRLLEKLVRSNKNIVLEGHLLCEFPLPVDVVVVLRVNPLILLKRMRARHYARKKISENLLCEMLDYCLVKSEENYGRNKVVQMDCSRGISVARALNRIKRKKSDFVDWIPLFLKERTLRFLLKQ